MKREIIVIGTVHEGWTPNKELKDVLEKIKPTQILVEITQEDINNDKFENYPPEMVFAHKWAERKKVKVNGFDSSINILKADATTTDEKKVIKAFEYLLKKRKFTWKDMNKENLQKIFCETNNLLIDDAKDKQRQREMLKNIIHTIMKSGKIVIITGAGHLNFFEKHLKNAVFPFRT